MTRATTTVPSTAGAATRSAVSPLGRGTRVPTSTPAHPNHKPTDATSRGAADHEDIACASTVPVVNGSAAHRTRTTHGSGRLVGMAPYSRVRQW